MGSTNFIKSAVGALVVVIVALVVVLPIFAAAEQTTATFTNDGYLRMAKYSDTDTDEITVNWTYADKDVITVNGEDINISGPANSGLSVVVLTDTGIFRAGLGTTGTIGNIGYITSTSRVFAEVGNSGTIAATFSGGNYTAVVNGVTYTGTYNELYVPDENGAYVMKYNDSPAYISSTSEIIAYGISAVNTHSSTKQPGVSITGIINNLDLDLWRDGDNITCSDVTVHATAVADYIGLYSLDKLTFTATYSEVVDGEDVTTDTAITYSYFIVPYEVTVELAEHADGITLTIIQILPVIILVGVLMMIVTAFISNRRA